MRIAGSVLIILSVIAIGIAFIMDTSVSTYSVSSGLGLGLNLPSQVSNLGLMQKQMMVLQTGLAGFVAGSVLYGMGEIVDMLRPTADPAAPEVRAASASEPPEPEQANPDTPSDTPVIVALIIGAFVLLVIILAITTNVRRAGTADGNTAIDDTAINVEVDALNVVEPLDQLENNIEAAVKE